MNRVRQRLTYANVMSTIAVFAVLAGGSAWAASKIGTKDIKDGAVTAKKLRDKAVTTKKIDDDAVAPKAKIGISPVAYASVGQDGIVDAGLSRGLSNANVVTNPPGTDPGTYCIKGLSGVKTAMVVADTGGGDNHATIRIGEAAMAPGYCSNVAGTQFAVSTFDLVGAAEKGFYIWFFN